MSQSSPGNADQIEHWNGVAARQWTDQQEEMDALLAPVSEALFAAAAIRPGMRVIDVGCGCGDTTLALAQRVGPGGYAVGIDVSEPMLHRARERTPPGAPVEFLLADAGTHPFSGDADLLFSRFGVMFFADPARSFANLHTAMTGDGRLIFACWRDMSLCQWMTVPFEAAVAAIGTRPPALPPHAPGAFAFASEQRIHNVLGEAGFADIATRPLDVSLDLAAGRGLDRAVTCCFDIGPTSRLVAGQPGEVQAAAARAVASALAPYRRGDSVTLAGAIWIVTASA